MAGSIRQRGRTETSVMGSQTPSPWARIPVPASSDLGYVARPRRAPIRATRYATSSATVTAGIVSAYATVRVRAELPEDSPVGARGRSTAPPAALVGNGV